MNKIKFRGKLSHSNIWIYGNLIIASDGKSYIIPFDLIKTDGHHLIIDSDCPFWVDAETVGQCTGLVDKCNNDIYEGDILEYNFKRTPVEWDNYQSGWNIVGYGIFLCEIVGNIHETKETP